MGYPFVGGNVFVPAVDNRNEATISSDFFASKYFEYEIAYKQAADMLVNKVIDETSLFKSVSVYPIMFLYRQFIELYIKDMLFRFDVEFNGKKKPYDGHDAYKLWKKLLRIVEDKLECFPQKIGDANFIDILSATDSYIEEIANMDNNSMAFRYPDDKTHTKAFFQTKHLLI